MSWGFFCVAELSLPATEWKRLKKTNTGDHPVAEDFWGFEDKELEETFNNAEADDIEVGDVTDCFKAQEGHGSAKAEKGKTKVRLAAVLNDSSEPYIAKVVAALIAGAGKEVSGFVVLCNDGTYEGEEGVFLEIEAGKIRRERIADCNAFSDSLFDATQGESFPTGEEVKTLASKKPKRKFTIPK